MNKVYSVQILLTILGSQIFLSCEKNNTGLPVDGDGNVYDTIVVGTQVWLAENLKTTKYYNGISIQKVIDDNEWASKASDAYCWYDNHPDFKTTYGALYNWYTVNKKNLCPLGYHVPTIDDWTILIDYLGGTEVAGGKLKEAGLAYWQSPNQGATDETGFTAKAGGQRYPAGNFADIGRSSVWWTSSQSNNNDNDALKITIYYTSSTINKGNYNNRLGASVRCIKDLKKS